MEPCIAVSGKDGDKFFISGGGGPFQEVPENGPVKAFYCQTDKGNKYPLNAINVGTVQVKCYSSRDACWAQEEPIVTYPVTIIAPTITTNAKDTYEPGDEVTFATALTNTSAAVSEGDIIELTEEYKATNVHKTNEEAPFTYQAKTEIIEGSDLVVKSNADYSQALKSTENLKFTGEGTVKIKVSYVPVYYYSENEIDDSGKNLVSSTYSPSKIITIQVKRTNTIRYAGANRYETSFLAADGLKQSLGVDKFDNIIVASGDNYPDALAGSYLGKVKDAPILLATGTTEKTTSDYIKSNLKEGGTVYLLGGTGVVSSNFEKMVKASGVSVERLAGANRYDTNIAILKEAGVKSEDILVCSGSGYADSLSASAVGKPILLVDEKITAKQQNYLDTLSTKNMYLIGGTGAVSKAVEKDLNGYTLKRFAGANRFETSTMVANEFFPKSECIVLAYGYNFPDGLSGGPLAMSIGAPLVLTSNESACVYTVRNYAKSAGVTKTVILGGQSLISDGNASSIIN